MASFFLCSHESMTPIPVCHLPVASLSFFSSPRLSFLVIPSYTEDGFASFPAPRLKGEVTVYSMPARGSNAQHHFQYSAPCFNDPLCSFCFSLHLSLLYTLHLIFVLLLFHFLAAILFLQVPEDNQRWRLCRYE